MIDVVKKGTDRLGGEHARRVLGEKRLDVAAQIAVELNREKYPRRRQPDRGAEHLPPPADQRVDQPTGQGLDVKRHASASAAQTWSATDRNAVDRKPSLRPSISVLKGTSRHSCAAER